MHRDGRDLPFLDAHCHLADRRVEGQVDEILRECEREGIGAFLLGGVDPVDWKRQDELERAYPGKFFKSYGLHPWVVDRIVQDEADPAMRTQKIGALFEELKRRLPQAHALGETGLDGSRDRFKRSRVEQTLAFEWQLGLAQEMDKAVVLHVVRAHAQALDLLEQPRFAGVGGMVHSFSGTQNDAQRYLRLGWLLSFSARLTHPQAGELREIVKKCPADCLLFETDAPDQPPFGHEGPLHTPVSLLKVVGEASTLRGESSESLLIQSRENLARVFRLPV